jgi:protein-S-isoprenylcysteine O-methyltransferase Ste14
MTQPEPSEFLVRAVSLYLPILLVLALALHRRPRRERVAGALLAAAWNIPALLAVNLIAMRAGWWSFDAHTATVAGIPADLWLGWALLWGAVPILAANRLLLVGVALLAVDLALMRFAAPVVVLDRTWLVGEALAVVTCLIPGLLLGRWTAHHEHLNARATLQTIAFTGLLLLVVPSLIFTITGESWTPLLERPRWQFVLAALAIVPAGTMAIQSVREFAAHGGTPVPLDPPTALVTTGPYSYVANPMQLGATIVLAAWGLLLTSPAIVAAAMSAAFSAGIAAWTEDHELAQRFGDDWHHYRRQVRLWIPQWRPAVPRSAVVYVASSCGPCSDVGAFITRRRSIGLDVESAERCQEPLRRITYLCGTQRAAGVAAIGRSLEHVNLAWATASWIARLPVVEPVLQLITDAVGGGPGPLATRSTS